MTGLRGRVGAVPALVAGGMMPLAFAPFNLWFLAPLALAVPLRLALAATPRQAALYGYLFGLGWFAGGVHWIYVSCHRYGNMDAPSAALATAVLVAYLALFPALGLLLARRLGRSRAAFLLAAPGTFGLAEWLRGWLLTGFPWLAPGYSQIDSPLGAYAPLGGVAGVGLVLLAVAAALAWLSTWPRRRWPALAALVLLPAGGVLVDRLDWSEPAGPALELALLQGNVEQQIKWDPAHFEQTLARYLDLTRAADGADVIIWPENAIPALPGQLPAGYLETVRAAAAGAAVLVGIPTEDPDGRYYNAVLQLTPPGGEYRKRHLVPFGEYVPFKRQVGPVLDLLAVPMSDFSTGGAGQVPLQVAGSSVAASVCYEILFPREMRAGAAAQWLVNVSNDAWFGDSIAPPQHLQIARMRARELARPIARATNTGITALIDARGRVATQVAPFSVTTLRGHIVPQRGLTPFARYGEAPVIALCLVLCGVAWRRRGS
ncbi:apolipoprotein N-acyltransferase [Immundisolibacter sp.]|uniref:apolipoprotein N-acyltransferase n=1 Tax=Immundisolibacter sp. TaxID=1934948 RepID=UPI003F857090